LPDAGLLLTLPAQSVIVRLLLGGVVAVIVARLLLRAGLRVPGIRVITALLPATVLLVILVVSVGDYRLPGLMAPSADSGSVLVPIANTYAYLAPVAVPALVSAWALVTLLRLVNRLQGAWRFSRDAARTAAASSVPLEVRCTVRRVAARMGLDAPPVALASACPGGASVIGFRRPTVVLDADLVDRLDPLELEGVVAHELAHVQRRDNLMALLLSVTRDLLFFVPGGRWALRQLLVERERAADDLAIQTTQRPGALAGGLLKVLESAGHRHACAALLPAGTLVDRVQLLVDAPPAPSRRRRVGEFTAVTAAFAVVVLAATVVPRTIAGSDPDGGLGVLLTAPSTAAPQVAAGPAPAPRVFETYHRAVLRTDTPAVQRAAAIDDDPGLVSRGMLAACAEGSTTCGAPARPRTMALQPPVQPVDVGLEMRWRGHPVVYSGDVLRIYWLSSIQ
jgi:beta-lactamase regulating signal transducer with metallopeptidase domain